METPRNTGLPASLNILDLGGAVNGFTASTSVNTRVVIALGGATKYNTVYLDNEGSSSGTFIIEEAPIVSYAGVWSVLGTLTFTAGTAVAAFHCPPGAYGAIGVRMTVAPTGGTIYPTYVGN